MSDGIDELRVDLARERGLPAGAESFLTASTLVELEEQADALARTLAPPRAPEGEPAPALDPFTIATEQKQQRKRAILGLFSGRETQPRDAGGQFVPKGSFDGGARESIPPPRNPEADHNQLINSVATVARMFGRSDF